MKDIPLDVAHFAGLLVALYLYGILIVMFAASIRPLWNRRHRSKFVLVVTICVFVIATVNMGIYISMNYNAFTKYKSREEAVAYLNEVYSPTIPLRKAILSDFFLAATTIASDVLLIWRVYVIWSRNVWIIVPPIFFLVLETGGELFLVVEAFLHPQPGKTGYPAVLIMSAISIALLNVMCTVSIVGRLWWIGGKNVQPRETRSLYKTIVMRMIESGTLYTVTLLVFAIFSTLGSYPGIATFVVYAFIMIAAIAPMLLVMHLNATTRSEMHIVEENVTGGRRFPSDLEATLPQDGIGRAVTSIRLSPMSSGAKQYDQTSECAVDADKTP
ncbi:hypothetical protein FRB93_005770 [Tulasnella sp. JGI-2019a]|nr:hypothetical protein FRB93_005770 [Tulasnella sp. JGI-2019a]